MRVGAVAVRNLAVTLCISARMQDRNVYGTHGQRLVDHGIGTAYLARLVAEDVDANPETAFLCGLLHDIGKMVILKWHHDHSKRTGAGLPAGELDELLERWHPMTAGRAFRRWGLPADLDEPVLSITTTPRPRPTGGWRRWCTSPIASATATGSAAIRTASIRWVMQCARNSDSTRSG